MVSLIYISPTCLTIPPSLRRRTPLSSTLVTNTLSTILRISSSDTLSSPSSLMRAPHSKNARHPISTSQSSTTIDLLSASLPSDRPPLSIHAPYVVCLSLPAAAAQFCSKCSASRACCSHDCASCALRCLTRTCTRHFCRL